MNLIELLTIYNEFVPEAFHSLNQTPGNRSEYVDPDPDSVVSTVPKTEPTQMLRPVTHRLDAV